MYIVDNERGRPGSVYRSATGIYIRAKALLDRIIGEPLAADPGAK